MFRQLERAENSSRLVEAGLRIALTRAGGEDEWKSVLQTAAAWDSYSQHYDAATQSDAVDWLLRDRNNPSSVLSVMEQARSNAKLVRTAITREVFENVNDMYLRMKELLARRVNERELPEVLDRIRARTALVRGALHGTMLRNDIYDFARIGTFMERADSTARILDVKYYVLLPSASAVGSRLDNVQWEQILRSAASEGGFRMAMGPDATPSAIASFLILDRRMPRSLAFCMTKIRDNLGYLAQDYDRRLPCHDAAEALAQRHLSRDIDAIFHEGLHEYLGGVLRDLGSLGRQIEIDYRFYE